MTLGNVAWEFGIVQLQAIVSTGRLDTFGSAVSSSRCIKILPIRTALHTARSPDSILSPARTMETPQILETNSIPLNSDPVGVVTTFSRQGKSDKASSISNRIKRSL